MRIYFQWEPNLSPLAIQGDRWQMPEGPWESVSFSYPSFIHESELVWSIESDALRGDVLRIALLDTASQLWTDWSVPYQVPEPDLAVGLLVGAAVVWAFDWRAGACE